MKDSITERRVTGSNVIHVSNWQTKRPRSTQLARDIFETRPQADRPPSNNIKFLFDSAQERIAGGGWLQFILAGLQALGLLVDAIKMLNKPGATTPIDEHAQPIEAFVQQSRRIIDQIRACSEENTIDALIDHLEGDAIASHGSTRVQLAIEEVRSAARTCKYNLTHEALQLSQANSQAVASAYQREIAGLKSQYEALNAQEKSKQGNRFAQEMGKLQEQAVQASRRAQQEVQQRAMVVEQQRSLLDTAQGCVVTAQKAADQAAINANASMPSATSKMEAISRDSRPAPTRQKDNASGMDMTHAVNFLSLATASFTALRDARSRSEAYRILSEHDQHGALGNMPPHDREVCLTLLWQELQNNGELGQFAARLLNA